MNLAGKRVLITGASGGIGHAIARAFAAQKSQLVLTGRRAEVLEPLSRGLDAEMIVADLGNRDDVERLVSEAGQVDIYVANAALPASGKVTVLSQEQIDAMLEINLRAPIAVARALAPEMALRRCGHMVFVSSLSGKAASPYSSLYSATKFGLRGFALGARQDLAEDGVGVSVVLPGFISDAGMFADSGAKLPFGVGTKTPAQVAAGVIEAILHDRAELSVAPIGLKIGTSIASLSPRLAEQVQKLAGGRKVARQVTDGQLSKRP
jgi:short-subunit dehydrogenase